MLEGIQAQQQNVSEIARMKTLVQLGRRVAHEVKNPLTPIRLSAEQILRSLQDKGEAGREVIATAVRYIIEETEHLRRVAYGFLNLSKLDELQAEPFRLDDLVADAVSHLRAIYPQVRFSVAAANAAGIDVVADRQKIKQVIDNVLTNALEALGGRAGEIDVSLAEEAGLAVVRIRDNGEGIGSEELERIAREEFSSKDLGTGLGLVIARRFLELHRGGLEIESRPGQGTTVVMRFAQPCAASLIRCIPATRSASSCRRRRPGSRSAARGCRPCATWAFSSREVADPLSGADFRSRPPQQALDDLQGFFRRRRDQSPLGRPRRLRRQLPAALAGDVWRFRNRRSSSPLPTPVISCGTCWTGGSMVVFYGPMVYGGLAAGNFDREARCWRH